MSLRRIVRRITTFFRRRKKREHDRSMYPMF
jgi:hypothetical protein